MPNKRLDWEEKVVLYQMIGAVCRQDDDGYAVYNEGWDDARVGREMTRSVEGRVTVNVPVVAKIRVDKFGHFRRIPGGTQRIKIIDFRAVVERLHLVEERLDQLEAAATAPTTDAPVFSPRGVA